MVTRDDDARGGARGTRDGSNAEAWIVRGMTMTPTRVDARVDA